MNIIDPRDLANDNHIPSIAAGITVGIVTNIDDPEKLGRIKVRLISRTTSDYETDFIPVSTSMSGSEWGNYFLPEVGTQVVVGFIDNSISCPVVLSSLYNQNMKPPKSPQDGKNDDRMIKTRNGNLVAFSDVEGEESVTIQTAGQLQMVFADKDQTITISNSDNQTFVKLDMQNGEISIQAEKKISLIAGSSKLTLDGNGSGTATFESGGKVTVKGQEIELTGQSKVTASGQASVDIKSSGQVNVQATGPANIKGAIVKLN